jgi:hypothetical protein
MSKKAFEAIKAGLEDARAYANGDKARGTAKRPRPYSRHTTRLKSDPQIEALARQMLRGIALEQKLGAERCWGGSDRKGRVRT